MRTTKRYFYVTFMVAKDDGVNFIGSMDVICKKNTYVKRSFLKQEISNDVGANSNNITITNIIEITESDYNDWNA